MNGSWIIVFDDPTILMIVVSLRRLRADKRMVVVMSMTAASNMTAARAAAMSVARLSTWKSVLKMSRWSTTTSTPSRFCVASATTWNCSGSLSFTRSAGCMSSAVRCCEK